MQKNLRLLHFPNSFIINKYRSHWINIYYQTSTLSVSLYFPLQDGIQSGIFRDAGFHSMTVQKTTTTTGATPGNASKSSGLSAGASAGLALGIIILVALICVAVAVLVIIW